ncbi:MAG: hypothetical protein FJ295_14600 [Planctomycetes bacterium]|nr:hypothetical protein [Planctomycetota bacterium]
MKRLLLAVAAVVVVFANGCHHHNLARNSSGCRSCGRGGAMAGMREIPDNGQEGPAMASVAYPYYTLHGPRDFLQNNPPTLGH